MSANNFSNPATLSSFNWSRLVLYVVLGLSVAVVIGITAVYFSPIGQRWQANQVNTAPAMDVKQIDIVANEALNHIFSPAVTQVEARTTVTWHFKDVDEDGQPVEHNVVFADVASPIQSGGTFSRTFAEPGSYKYVCTLHPFMEGTVIVIE